MRTDQKRGLPQIVLAWIPALAVCLLMTGACSSSEEDEAPPEPACDVTAFVPDAALGKETEVMVPMRDCVRLSTDIYLPYVAGPTPAVLIRLPYDKEQGIKDLPLMKIVAFLFQLEGYAVVIQDTRGRFDSEGVWVPFDSEQEDGIDTVRWIEVQPWFNGNLGMFGGSYFGFTQLAVACQRPASLKVIAPLIISSDVYSWLFYSGLPRTDMVVNWALAMKEKDHFDDLPYETFEKAALHWPLIEGDDATVGDIPWYNAWLEHPFDNGYYDPFMPPGSMEKIEVPMLMLTGWFDIFLPGQLQDFLAARAREVVPGNTRIIIGPWTHGMGLFEQHDFHFGDGRSVVSFMGQILNWYAHFLKGETLDSWGPVTIYDPGTGGWQDQSELWHASRTEYALYLQGDQGAASCTPAGSLAGAPVPEPSVITYTYDPLDPVINYGGPLLNMDSGCLREMPHCDRPDVLTFESLPLEESLAIDGEIHLDLQVSSSAPDTAFVGRLSFVQPDGTAFYLRQGVETLSHREGNDHQTAYTVGQVVEIRIDMPPVLWTLQPGQRLRLEISSSSFPSVAQHPNVDRAWFHEANPLPAEQRLHLIPQAPSKLVLSVDR